MLLLLFFFSIILGEDSSSKEELENTPSGEELRLTQFGWFGDQGKVVKKQINECLGIQCCLKSVFVSPNSLIWLLSFPFLAM